MSSKRLFNIILHIKEHDRISEKTHKVVVVLCTSSGEVIVYMYPTFTRVLYTKNYCGPVFNILSNLYVKPPCDLLSFPLLEV